MGEFIVKATPDDEIYLIWSTIVDAPTWIFDSREELREHLNGDPNGRIDRTDRSGTSAIDPPGAYGWDDEAFLIREVTPDDGWWYELPRTRLADYARAVLADDEPAAHACLRRSDRIGS